MRRPCRPHRAAARPDEPADRRLGRDGRPELEPGPVALPPERVSFRAALRLLREPRFRILAVVGGVLALATISDGFIYLGLQRNLDFSPTLLPLLYVGTACAYMVLAVPFGVLADHVGRWPVFIVGYSLLTVVYAALLLEGLGTVALVGFLLLFGAYYAATDGASRRWRAPCCLSTCGPVDWRCSSP
jgi:predicted MFS family arabinose efflux permease